MTATFGGPLINVRAQVINTEDKIIPGLYAAGNAAGGLFHGDYIVGSQLGAAIVFGRIAAADACARTQ
jgi:fumarate reductase flavoprotein subunit